MMRDEDSSPDPFPDPDAFDPERHAAEGYRCASEAAIDNRLTAEDGTVSAASGFSRRFCPGRTVAEFMLKLTDGLGSVRHPPMHRCHHRRGNSSLEFEHEIVS